MALLDWLEAGAALVGGLCLASEQATKFRLQYEDCSDRELYMRYADLHWQEMMDELDALETIEYNVVKNLCSERGIL